MGNKTRVPLRPWEGTSSRTLCSQSIHLHHLNMPYTRENRTRGGENERGRLRRKGQRSGEGIG